MEGVKRMKVEFAQAETATTELPEAIAKMENVVEAIAALGTELLKKPEPAPKAEKTEKAATKVKADETKPAETKVEPEAQAAQAAAPTTTVRKTPMRDAKGHFMKATK